MLGVYCQDLEFKTLTLIKDVVVELLQTFATLTPGISTYQESGFLVRIQALIFLDGGGNWQTKALPIWIEKFGDPGDIVKPPPKPKQPKASARSTIKSQRHNPSGSSRKSNPAARSDELKRPASGELERINKRVKPVHDTSSSPQVRNAPRFRSLEDIDRADTFRQWYDLGNDVSATIASDMAVLLKYDTEAQQPPPVELLKNIRGRAQNVYQSLPQTDPKGMFSDPDWTAWESKVVKVPKPSVVVEQHETGYQGHEALRRVLLLVKELKEWQARGRIADAKMTDV
ncbi:hypothetical protein P153DRAFT_393700 [Dothidotthia symphoricarpi CBS 119687]|uniref:Uncharacterized protein n=1 Tax=Dothidotthia symphoricarpi CBS 119687 TaxID=1392245 RepID=A0A6A6APC4_9PLEO|nr:uncharacterized protein P153DRAFT_393700 [Dothidotthia symphoricarpi CBS 119687]KAF2132737.1 hypothetical protein P153DRAFT_393700 [Dothidotthia symphoricarpi CBS 119687]